jgi:hypothetical protein
VRKDRSANHTLTRLGKPASKPAGKVKITIRPDADAVDQFMARADESGGSVAARNRGSRPHGGHQQGR